MIPRDYITEWRAYAPWVQDSHVEQDLILSRALVEIHSHPLLGGALAFCGGTALYKLYSAQPPATRRILISSRSTPALPVRSSARSARLSTRGWGRLAGSRRRVGQGSSIDSIQKTLRSAAFV